jgi:L-2-hydroxyglutarate oxidase
VKAQVASRPPVVIGAGIVGLATAYKLLLSRGHDGVIVLEKEPGIARHQSTHNSGVLHAGLHYEPGSQKARLARDGFAQMVTFCDTHGIAYEQCGKLVVATSATEEERLKALLDRGTRNGLSGLRWLSRSEIRDVEPHAVGMSAVHVPEEGIVDYGAVCVALKQEIERLGGQIILGSTVQRLRRKSGFWEIDAGVRTLEAGLLVNCAGLHADRIASLAGERPGVRIIPFRGEYWRLRPDRAHLVRHLLYPVPDPTFPFLGVHLTRMVHGGVVAGPNAVLALSREGYGWTDVNLRDMAESLSSPALWRFLARYPRVATYEIARSFSRKMFLSSLRKLVPDLKADDLVSGPSGVRAQAMSSDGRLVQDFQIIAREGAVHVINAPSPAATASLAIADEIVRRVECAQ